MDFSVNPAEFEWQARARRLAASLAFRAAEHDRTATFPWESWKALQEAGFLALAVPEDMGGMWDGYIPYCLAALEIAAGDPSVMCALSMHFGCTFNLLSSGSAEQRERYTREIVERGAWFGVASAESSSGPPGTHGIVHARRDGDAWILSGIKHFVTSAGCATHLIVPARGADGAVHTFIVSQASGGHLCSGIVVERTAESLGLRASATYNVRFHETRVPASDELLGAGPDSPGGFFAGAGFALGLSATVLGPAIAAWRWTRQNLREMQQKSPKSLTQERLRLLATMYTELQAARSLLLRAAWTAENDPGNLTAALQAARLNCTRAAVRVTQDAMLAAGGRGYLESTPLERHVRDALAGPLQAGCHETCPARVAEALLKEGAPEL